jgi:hypothetical protein
VDTTSSPTHKHFKMHPLLLPITQHTRSMSLEVGLTSFKLQNSIYRVIPCYPRYILRGNHRIIIMACWDLFLFLPNLRFCPFPCRYFLIPNVFIQKSNCETWKPPRTTRTLYNDSCGCSYASPAPLKILNPTHLPIWEVGGLMFAAALSHQWLWSHGVLWKSDSESVRVLNSESSLESIMISILVHLGVCGRDWESKSLILMLSLLRRRNNDSASILSRFWLPESGIRIGSESISESHQNCHWITNSDLPY